MTILGALFLFLLCAYLPFLTLRAGRKLRTDGKQPTRAQYLQSFVVLQGFMLILALCTAHFEHVDIFTAFTFSIGGVIAGAALFALGFGTLPARWQWKTHEEQNRVAFMYPHAARDLWWWAGVSLVAGFVEEIVYRGVAMTLWQRVLESQLGFAELPATIVAVALCVAAFTIAHAVQGWKSLVAIVVLATASHVVVLLSGNLYAAMIVHAVYDFAAGLYVSRTMARVWAPAQRHLAP